MLSGAIVTESVFNYPGMGLLFWNAALSHDFPLLLGFTVVIAAATVAGSCWPTSCTDRRSEGAP